MCIYKSKRRLSCERRLFLDYNRILLKDYLTAIMLEVLFVAGLTYGCGFYRRRSYYSNLGKARRIAVFNGHQPVLPGSAEAGVRHHVACLVGPAQENAVRFGKGRIIGDFI